jgi:hypothetical protein
MEKENTELTPDELIEQKLRDVETPGYEVSFDPDEAEKIAFHRRRCWRGRGRVQWRVCASR